MTASEREALVARVRAILAASEERDYDYISVNVDESDLRALCAEVERLTGMADAYRTTIADYDKRVGALQDEVERLREDAARLDWLEAEDWVELYPNFGGGIAVRYGDALNRVSQSGLTLRAAIDAARTTGGRDA